VHESVTVVIHAKRGYLNSVLKFKRVILNQISQ
jgi:hypothetical protein